MPWFLLCILIGQVTLFADWGSRLLGAYARTFWSYAIRAFVLLVCCVALTMPIELLYFGIDTPLVRALVWSTSVLSLVAFAHFLLPYRFGIRKLPMLPVRSAPLVKGSHLVEVRLRMSDLPEALDGLSCLVLSDLHCNSAAALEHLKGVTEALRARSFDIVFILGDLSDRTRMLEPLIEVLSGIESRLGSFCVRGNHDFERGRAGLIESLLAGSPVALLSNESRTAAEAGLTVIGSESPWRRPPLREGVASGFAIGLTHTPDNMFRLQRAGARLCLAGHTHGGIHLPLVGSVLVRCKHGRFLDNGLFGFHNCLLFITSGGGYPEERLWRKSEVVQLTLERASSGSR